MPRGVYARKPLSSDYRGFPRIRQVKRNGEGSEAIVAVACGGCGDPLERTAKAVKRATSEGRDFTCATCHARHMVEVRMNKMKRQS